MSTENQEPPHHQAPAGSLVPAEQRHCMIAEAAYFIAERWDFEGDREAHWLEAECEIDRMLGATAADSSFLPD